MNKWKSHACLVICNHSIVMTSIYSFLQMSYQNMNCIGNTNSQLSALDFIQHATRDAVHHPAPGFSHKQNQTSLYFFVTAHSFLDLDLLQD